MAATIRARFAVAVVLLLGAGCAGDSTGGTSSDSSASTSDIATVADGIDTASDMANAPDTAGLMLGLVHLPRIPDGLEGFRCDVTPKITVTTVCGHMFPSSIELTWTSCDAHGPRDVFRHRDEADGGTDRMTSMGTVTITNTVTTDPVGSCSLTATITIAREATFDVTTTAADGSREVAGTVSTTSTRDPSAETFVNAETHDVTITEKDTGGAVVSSRHLAGTLTSTFAVADGMATRTLSGELSDTKDGATASVTITDLVRPALLVCRWPTSGTIVRTAADGTAHTLVFGPTCGSATLDGTAVTLPTASFGFHSGHD